MTANHWKISQTHHFSQIATFLSTCNSLEFRTFIWISFLYVYPENEMDVLYAMGVSRKAENKIKKNIFFFIHALFNTAISDFQV
jgi:hypothetical protein